jgi:hypothetical protein
VRLSGHEPGRGLLSPNLGGCPVAVPLDDPGLVVGLLEGEQRQAQFLDGVEAADPQQVLLQHSDEALGTAVPFRLADEGGRALDAEEADLGLEVVADVLTAVVVAEPKAGGDALGEAAGLWRKLGDDGLRRAAYRGG